MTDGLVSFGYTPREANFLKISSLLGGYFLRRQFNHFIEKRCGALAENFLKRGLSLKHFRRIPALGGRVIYHIACSSIYEALGEPENRNRREHQFEAVRLRLMALDFVIQHPSGDWLLTASEKLVYFSNCGVPLDHLPHADVSARCRRFFLEKQPVLLTADSVRFVFIDGGFRGWSQWVSFLKSHRQLFQLLPVSDIMFASCHRARLDSAERVFRRLIVGQNASGGFDLERLQRYFTARRSFGEKRFEAFDQSRLDALREDKRVFAGEEVERLYRHWCSNDKVSLNGLKACATSFKSQILPHPYDWLTPIQFYERRA